MLEPPARPLSQPGTERPAAAPGLDPGSAHRHNAGIPFAIVPVADQNGHPNSRSECLNAAGGRSQKELQCVWFC